MIEVVIVDAVRTPIGKYGGALASVRPDDLLARALESLIDKTGIDPSLIDDVYVLHRSQWMSTERDQIWLSRPSESAVVLPPN